MLEIIENDIDQLIKILKNLKKSIYHKITAKTLLAKASYAQQLFTEIEQNIIIHEAEIPENKLNYLIKAARESNHEIQQIVQKKLKENQLRENIATMANPPTFDIKTATALIQTYDGSPSGLDAFIDSVALLGDLTPAALTATAIKFLKTRLNGKARTALPPNPQSLNEITDAIKQACKSSETPDTLLAKLKATKNKGDQQKFCDEVEEISQKLSTLYVDSKIPVEVANKMATKAGVETLINGITNAELKIILKANEFGTIQKAIQKINETQPVQTAQIFTYKTQNSRGRGRGNYANNFQSPNNRSGYFQNNRSYQGNNYFQNSNNTRGNNRGQYNHRGYYRGNYTNNGRNHKSNYNQNRAGQGHNVFYAQAENCPVPQQIVVGGSPPNVPQQFSSNVQPHQPQNAHQCAILNRK